jgi:asparagine synthase (glutamine-hydrolysing)
MCGIAFVYRVDRAVESLSQDMEQSLSFMARRGPDGSGTVGGNGWMLGHRRLAVIDIIGSPQPMQDPSGRYSLSYNGELYNYRELREQLLNEWRFQTNGDVEVVLAGLVLYGTDFLNLMEGMWALALWDQNHQSLLLVRDRMGQKPIFFQSDSERFACASALKALQPLSWFAWQEDERSTADYLRYGYYLPGSTAYQKVREVLPGHCLYWNSGQPAIQKAYWTISTPGILSSHELARGQLQEAIVASVKKRLVADVEVGALLSGGVDSSLMVGIVRQELRRTLKTFTMGFGESSFDERPYARGIARHFGTTHHEDCLPLGGWERLVQLVLTETGQPFADGSLLPAAHVCLMASRHVKVAISGDGGDELFSGYQRYLGRSLLRWYTRLPKGVRSQTEKLISHFAEPGAHHSASLLKKAFLFLDLARQMDQTQPYVAPLKFSRTELMRVIPDLWRRGHTPPTIPDVDHPDDIHQMMAADALIYLPQDILTKVDRASMAFSLEVRSPFMDRRVVELAFAMPRQWHRWGFKGKRMLADCFSGLLPDWTWRRRKHGFGAPLHQWFRSGLQVQLKDLLHETPHPLAPSFVNHLIGMHETGRRDYGQQLWLIYIYLLWRSRFA